MERVGFGSRFGAALIDVVILFAVLAIVGMVLGVGTMSALGSMGGGAAAGGGMLMLALMGLIPLAYTSLEILKAATPGKMVLKLAIRNEDGSPAAQDTLAKRWAIKNSASLVGFVATVTGITMLHTLGSIIGLVIFIGCFLVLQETKQALHDKLGKTAVYRVA